MPGSGHAQRYKMRYYNLMDKFVTGLEGHVSFGYWLRRRRKALDLTQAELGRRAGASAAMIRKIEADERRPSRELGQSLARELAVAPEDRDAFLRAARGISLAAAPVLATAPLNPPAHNLPAPMTSLVNRKAALAEVSTLLRRDDVRLLTLIGPPGIGKTRLSIRAARETMLDFADGVWFVDLSTLTVAAQIMPAIAVTLPLEPAPGLPISQQVITALHEKRLLLIMDNLEQIVEGAALEIAHLLRACARIKVLATSRIRLDIYGEHEYTLPPMSLPPAADHYQVPELMRYEAVQLFLDRTRQHRPDFSLTEETAVPVAEICRQMDGLPLALELAAARTRRKSVSELVQALKETSGQDWHLLLRSTNRDLPPRQQTLFSAIAWSYSLLEADEQAFLRMLGIFEGSFVVAAAASVCFGASDAGSVQKAEMMLTHLEDQSLLSLVSTSPRRRRLLEMIREFALSEQTPEETALARQRHMRYFVQQSELLSADWVSTHMLAALDGDLANFYEALNTAVVLQDAAAAYELVSRFVYFWEAHGLLHEGRALLDRVLALPAEAESIPRYGVLHQASNLAWMQHDFEAAEERAAQAMAHVERYGLLPQKSSLLNMLGRIYIEQSRYEEADAALEHSINVARLVASFETLKFAKIQRGEVSLALGRLADARALTREGLVGLSPQEAIPFAVGWNNMAEIALALGDAEEAREALRRVFPVAHLHSRRLRFCLLGYAGLFLLDAEGAAEEVKTAVRLLGAIDAANGRLGDPLSPFGQEKLHERAAFSRTLLPEFTWQENWIEGRRWSLDTARDVLRPLI